MDGCFKQVLAQRYIRLNDRRRRKRRPHFEELRRFRELLERQILCARSSTRKGN